MVLFQIWPLLTLLLLLILGWQLYRFVRSIFRRLQLKLDSTRLQLYKEWEVMEAERTRIANDLHDDLGPLLSAVGMRMNCLHPASDTDQQHFKTMRKYLDEVIERLGIISHNLTPLALSQKGLQPAIQEFFARYDGVAGIDLEYVYEIKSNIPVNKGLQLYRIIQEIVQNGLKHSRASRIQVCLLEKNDSIVLLYADNGIGFNPDKINDADGLGIKSVKSRFEMLEGKMTLNTTPGKGVEYSFEVTAA